MFTENELIHRMYHANEVAIPLKPQNDSLLNPEPNFLVIDNIFDKIIAPFPDGQGGVVEIPCNNSVMRLVFREILPAENGKELGFREVLMDDIGNQPIPRQYYNILVDQETLIPNAEIINQMLPLFQFRGVLKGYQLEYDPAKSQEYIDFKEAEKAAKAEAEAARLAEIEAMNNPPAPAPTE